MLKSASEAIVRAFRNQAREAESNWAQAVTVRERARCWKLGLFSVISFEVLVAGLRKWR
jgi:hypothetical protein